MFMSIEYTTVLTKAQKLSYKERIKLENELNKMNKEMKDPLWSLGQNPVDTGISDGSSNHDNYVLSHK